MVYHSVPYRVFRMGSLYCSEGKGHTFESCRVRHFCHFHYANTEIAAETASEGATPCVSILLNMEEANDIAICSPVYLVHLFEPFDVAGQH
jgi:hypothetical protein